MPVAPHSKTTWRRLLILGGTSLLLWLLCFWIKSPSERFHALLVPLWCVNFVLCRRRINKVILTIGVLASALALVVFHSLGSFQASQLGADLAWWEPFQKLYFTEGLFVLYNVLCAVLNSLIRIIPAAHALMTAPRGWWLRFLRVALSLLVFVPYLYVSFNIHRFKYSSRATPQTRYALPFQSVNFVARDGVQLKGWFIPRQGSQKTIVVVHGIGSNRGDMLGVVPFLHRAGFNLFLFDLRSHGDSEGHTITFGINEARDVEAATEWASQKSGGKKVGVLAYSMGGSSVLHAVGENGLPQVSSIVLDSTFAEFAPVARGQMNFLPGEMQNPVLALLSFYTRLEIGVGLNDIAPRRYISRISPRPLFLIHGMRDTLIAPSQARLNYASAQEPKSLYLIEGAGHVKGHQVAGAVYEQRVGDFFDASLK